MVKGIKISGDLIQTSEIQKESLSVVPMIDSAELYKQITSGPYAMSWM